MIAFHPLNKYPELIKCFIEVLELQASQAKKSITKPRLSRSVTRKRDRNMACLEEQFRDLGADIHPAQLKNLAKEQLREPTVKKIRVGKSPSLVASRPPSRDVQGIKNDEVSSFSFLFFGSVYI